MTNKYWKDIHYTVITKVEIKAQWAITTCQLELLELERLTQPRAGKDVEKPGPSCIVGRNVNV